MAIPWHRIFGMALNQYFAGSAWQVDVEVDLSLQQQRLDLVVLRRLGDYPSPVWPDGFGTPADYNLLTFKALKDPLTPWVLKELAAHGVNYRKQISPNHEALLPEAHFRLLAATMHYPRLLDSQLVLQQQGPGTYDVLWGTDIIRILVLRDLPEAEQNVVWNLFSGDPERIGLAFRRIQPRLSAWSSLLNKLLNFYGLEGMAMPYTMEDLEREVAEELLQKMTPEQIRARLSPEQRLEGLSPEQILTHWSHEQFLAQLSREEIENYLKKQPPSQDPTTSEQPERQS